MGERVYVICEKCHGLRASYPSMAWAAFYNPGHPRHLFTTYSQGYRTCSHGQFQEIVNPEAPPSQPAERGVNK